MCYNVKLLHLQLHRKTKGHIDKAHYQNQKTRIQKIITIALYNNDHDDGIYKYRATSNG